MAFNANYENDAKEFGVFVGDHRYNRLPNGDFWYLSTLDISKHMFDYFYNELGTENIVSIRENFKKDMYIMIVKFDDEHIVNDLLNPKNILLYLRSIKINKLKNENN